MTINDGQLDHANREIERLRKSVEILSGVCAHRHDLLRQVIDSQIGHPANGVRILVIYEPLWEVIRAETDESEVEP